MATITIRKCLRAALVLAGMLLPGTAVGEFSWNLKPSNTALGHAVNDIHILVMIVIAAIFVGVFGFMFYAIFRHRKSLGHEAVHFHKNTTVEIIWTVVPLLIIVAMAWPATRVLLEMRDPSAPDMTIKVTAYQWKWGYEYIDDGIEFMSSLSTTREQIEGKAKKGENYLQEVDKPMVVPVGRKIRLLLTSNDVLHSWYVPELAVNQDAIPGVVRDASFRAEATGTYRGQCAQLCGKNHGFMPIVVKVVSVEEFATWLAEQKEASANASILGAPDFSAGNPSVRSMRLHDVQPQGGQANTPTYIVKTDS